MGLRIASAQDIRVLVTGAPSEAIQQVAATFAKTSGRTVSVDFDKVLVVMDQLAHGDTPDIIVLPERGMDELAKSGKLMPGSRIELARVGIGVAVREGAPLPDISTAAAVRQMLLGASSVVYPPVGGGQTGAYVGRMIMRMGIAGEVEPKTTRLYAIGGGVARVAEGKSEVGLFNISEIIPVKGAKLVGPLPAELQHYLTFSAAILASSAAPGPASDFLHALVDPSTIGMWEQSGLEPLALGH